MLMVVFGAGASYDSVPSRPPNKFPLPHRPPLVDELFADRSEFAEPMSLFPKIHPIIPNLRAIPEDSTLEQELEKLQKQSREHPARHGQLASVRFYLQYMLSQCQDRWNEDVAKGITNYNVLLDDIERLRRKEERICMVTFNYDTLLEAVLHTINIEVRDIHDYVADEYYTLIKLHGSVNWAREVETVIDANHGFDVAHELIAKADKLVISQRYRIVYVVR